MSILFIMDNHNEDKEIQRIKAKLEKQRYNTLRQLEDWLEFPTIILGFIWLVLLFIELTWGLTYGLEIAGYIIWGIFILDFMVKFILAPVKLSYIKKNWLTLLSLTVPALRIFRIIRVLRFVHAARAARGLRLIRLVSSLNRGIKALRRTMRKRRLGYVILLTTIVVLVGAAGMLAFENGKHPEGGFDNYGESLWWTSMIMTTLGSEFWPRTTEGRILAVFLSLYAFAVFGYVTATLATYFVGLEEVEKKGKDVSAGVEQLTHEVQSAKKEIEKLSEKIDNIRSGNKPDL